MVLMFIWLELSLVAILVFRLLPVSRAGKNIKGVYLMKRILGCVAVVLLLGVVPLLAQNFDGNEYKKGKTHYKNECQFCHGMRGDGKGPAAESLLMHPEDFTTTEFWQDDVEKKIDAEKKIEDTIKKGKEMMPAFDLTPREIKAVIGYMSHTFKKATQNNN
jgi:cytochrome c1